MASTIRISILADAARAVRGLRETGAEATGTGKKFDALRRQVSKLDNQKAEIKLDAKVASARMKQLEREIVKLNKKNVQLSVRTQGFTQVSAQIKSWQQQIATLNKQKAEVSFSAKGFVQGTAQIVAANLALTQIRKGVPDLSFGLTGLANKFTLVAAGAFAATAAVGPLVASTAAVGGAFAAAAAGAALFGAVALPTLQDVTTAVTEYNTASHALERAQAVGDTAAMSAAQKKMASSLGALTPLQRQAALQLISMNKSWKELSASQAPRVLAIISQAAGTLSRIIPRLSPAIEAMGRAFSTVSGAAFSGLEKSITPIVNFITGQGAPAFKSIATIIGNIAPTVGHLVQAFAPLGNQILASLIPLTAAMRSFNFESLAKSAASLLPVVSSLLGNLSGAVGNLLRAIAPLARPVLQGLSDIGGIIKTALGGPELKSFISNIAKIIPAVAPMVAVVVPAFIKFADIISGQVLALVPKMLPLIKQMADVFVNVLTGLSPLLGPLLDLVGIFISFIPILFPVITALRDALIPVFKVLGDALIQLKPSFTLLITAFTNLFGPISDVLIVLIKAAPALITSLVPAFVAIADVVGQLLVAFEPLFPVLAQIIGSLAVGLTPVIKALAAAMPSIAVAMVALARPVGALIIALQPVFPVLAQIITALVIGLTPVLLEVARIMPSVIAAAVPLIPAFLSILTALLPLIPPISQLAVMLIRLLVPILLNSIPPMVQMANLLGRVLPVAVSIVVGVINGLTSKVNFLISVWNRIPQLVNVITDFKNRVVSAISGLPQRFKDVAGNIISGFVNGLASGWHKVTEFFQRAIAIIPAGIRRALGISSPSKVMAGIGANIGEGLIAGIGAKVPELKQQLASVSSLIQDGVTADASVAFSTSSASVPIVADAAGAGNITYQVNVSVAPGADPAEVGRQTVKAIEAWERRTGRKRLVTA